MATPAQVKATTTYIKKHLRQYVIRANKETEADLVAWLDAQENVTQYLKGLVRADMKKEGECHGKL